MRKLVFLLLLTPLAFTTAIAQSDSGHCRYGGKHHYMGMITEDLALTPEQSKQVQAIMKEKREKTHAIRMAQREQAKPQLEAIRGETREQLATVLNEDQLQKLEASREAMKAKWREKRIRKNTEG